MSESQKKFLADLLKSGRISYQEFVAQHLSEAAK